MWDADRAWPRGHALFPPIILYICGRGTIAAEMHVHHPVRSHPATHYFTVIGARSKLENITMAAVRRITGTDPFSY